MFKILFLFVFFCLAIISESIFASASPKHTLVNQEHRDLIQSLKKSSKGPFRKIRWFCKDGTNLAPKPYACKSHGGGIQHGQWKDSVVSLREQGFLIGNVLAELKPEMFIGDGADLVALKQILLERFLMAADNGWIFRGARSYRGAIQVEDEEAASLRLLLAMLADLLWLEPARFTLLRESVRLLPEKNRSPATSQMRLLSATLHGKNPGFAKIRAKIHGAPDKTDALAVRQFAEQYIKKENRREYLHLAEIIDQVFSFKNTLGVLNTALKLKDSILKKRLKNTVSQLTDSAPADQKLVVVSEMMVSLRDAMAAKHSPREKLRLLRASLALEQEFFRISTELTERLPLASRQQQLLWLSSVSKAMYGVGFLYHRHLQSVEKRLKHLFESKPVTVEAYRRSLFYLARVVGWSDRTMAFNFQVSQNHVAQIEPLVHLYPQDRLRSSPLLFFGKVTDNLVMDANRLANKEHSFFGRPVGVGIRALNPGIAKGVLRMPNADNLTPDINGIYLLPETTSDLTPVSGILTQGEGNALSHIQLLARNLAIPNVVIGQQWLDELNKHVGETVVMAVSSDGVMVLEKNAEKWDQYFSKKTHAEPADILIKPDLDKLNLDHRTFISLANLRASDSGKVSGPKGANLGELTHRFGKVVPSGFVIPFGVFKAYLDQPLEAGGPSVFTWMKQSYTEISAMPIGSEDRAKKVSQFLGRLRNWVETSDPGVEFKEQLKLALQTHFGTDGQFGVFIRSDTNVEDLPGFTGAGLNHTVGNVIGYDNILKAIQKVWASPFTERAFAWRQTHMNQPEYVFPAVLVQYSFPSEKSGVMVTKDVLWNTPGWISVAVNEGIGGAVDGQSAESLRVNITTGEVQFLSHATAVAKKQAAKTSGLEKVPASGSERVLTKAEIQQLVQLARDIPVKFPSLQDENGKSLTADVEFAFKDGRLALLQIRPFVEAKNAKKMGFVSTENTVKSDANVDLEALPNEKKQ